MWQPKTPRTSKQRATDMTIGTLEGLAALGTLYLTHHYSPHITTQLQQGKSLPEVFCDATLEGLAFLGAAYFLNNAYGRITNQHFQAAGNHKHPVHTTLEHLASAYKTYGQYKHHTKT